MVKATVAAAVLLVVSGALAGCQPSVTPPREYAVYAEYSDASKPMAVGWNTRIFDRREVQAGTNIRLEDKTGVVVLEPGLYHITASSIVSYADEKNPSIMPMKNPAFAGYARLRYLADVGSFETGNDKAVAISTVSNTDALPSLIDTFLRVEKQVKLVLEHQVGNQAKDVGGVYLHVRGNGSSWHVSARISVERMPS